MNTLAFKLVQALCVILLLLTVGLVVDIVRAMWDLPLYHMQAWSMLAPQFGMLMAAIATIVLVEYAAYEAPYRRLRRGD